MVKVLDLSRELSFERNVDICRTRGTVKAYPLPS